MNDYDRYTFFKIDNMLFKETLRPLDLYASNHFDVLKTLIEIKDKNLSSQIQWKEWNVLNPATIVKYVIIC